MQMKDPTIDEFKSLIRATVEEILQDLLVDPDAGRPIKEARRQQLLHLQERRASAKLTLSSEQVMEELG
jgi:maltooligosyltrehalose synthase